MKQWRVDNGEWTDVTRKQTHRSNRGLEFPGCLFLATLLLVVLFGIAMILNPQNGYVFPEPQPVSVSRNASDASGFLSGILFIVPGAGIALFVLWAIANGKVKKSPEIISLPLTKEQYLEYYRKQREKGS